MFFLIKESDLVDPFYKETMGVWKLVIQQDRIQTVERVVRIDQWYQMLGPRLVTQPTLLKKIKSVVERQKDDPAQALKGRNRSRAHLPKFLRL